MAVGFIGDQKRVERVGVYQRGLKGNGLSSHRLIELTL
jgi:hypothetical protein